MKAYSHITLRDGHVWGLSGESSFSALELAVGILSEKGFLSVPSGELISLSPSFLFHAEPFE